MWVGARCGCDWQQQLWCSRQRALPTPRHARTRLPGEEAVALQPVLLQAGVHGGRQLHGAPPAAAVCRRSVVAASAVGVAVFPLLCLPRLLLSVPSLLGLLRVVAPASSTVGRLGRPIHHHPLLHVCRQLLRFCGCWRWCLPARCRCHGAACAVLRCIPLLLAVAAKPHVAALRLRHALQKQRLASRRLLAGRLLLVGRHRLASRLASGSATAAAGSSQQLGLQIRHAHRRLERALLRLLPLLRQLALRGSTVQMELQVGSRHGASHIGLLRLLRVPMVVRMAVAAVAAVVVVAVPVVVVPVVAVAVRLLVCRRHPLKGRWAEAFGGRLPLSRLLGFVVIIKAAGTGIPCLLPGAGGVDPPLRRRRGLPGEVLHGHMVLLRIRKRRLQLRLLLLLLLAGLLCTVWAAATRSRRRLRCGGLLCCRRLQGCRVHMHAKRVALKLILPLPAGPKAGGQAQCRQLRHLRLVESKLVLVVEPPAQAVRRAALHPCRLLVLLHARCTPPLVAPAEWSKEAGWGGEGERRRAGGGAAAPLPPTRRHCSYKARPSQLRRPHHTSPMSSKMRVCRVQAPALPTAYMAVSSRCSSRQVSTVQGCRVSSMVAEFGSAGRIRVAW